SDEIRRRLEQRFCRPGAPDPYDELCRVDPRSAARIHKNDRQRVLRGLEIYHSSGVPWSEHLEKQKKREPLVRFSQLFGVYLHCPRDILYKRIARRTDMMLAHGFVEEVERLRGMGYGPELASMQSIGYRHVNRFLDGNWDKEMMKNLLTRDTRRYAKRQMTWFRRMDILRRYGRDDQENIISDILNYFQENNM
ncbi:MAG TPA: tRNA (adenosine(37)-N6)-dimethylallyltransferase MiaA, partial [Desulfobulbus sp.]|nr:tRNA (adenosine(37)-N6)-dimethylallyltransferase MiaA [Desulfobulbus sp.]